MSKLSQVYMIHKDRESACIGGRVINWVPEKKRKKVKSVTFCSFEPLIILS